MKKLMIAGVIAVLGVAAVGKAAERNMALWGQNRRGQFLAQHLANDLNLTTDQRAQIRVILQNERPKIQGIAQELLQENAQLRSKTTFDEAFVRSVAQQRSATMTEALVEREKVRAEIFALLTPAQLDRANQLSEEFRARLEERISNLGAGI